MQLKVKSNKDHFAEGKMKLIFLQNPKYLTSAFNYFSVFLTSHYLYSLSLSDGWLWRSASGCSG